MGLQVVGTLGVIVKAKSQGYVESVKPLMESLIDNGLYVSDGVRQMVLREAGESL